MNDNKKEELNQYFEDKKINKNSGLFNLGLLLLIFSGVDIKENLSKFIDYIETSEIENNTDNKDKINESK